MNEFQLHPIAQGTGRFEERELGLPRAGETGLLLLLRNRQLTNRPVVALERVRRIDLDQIISHLFVLADVKPDGS